MLIGRKCKLFLFLCFLFAFVIAFVGFRKREEKFCMGVPLIQASALDDCTEIFDLDSRLLTFNGEVAAVDMESSTVYISQTDETIIHYSNLQGNLFFKHPLYSLYFIEDESLMYLPETVRNGATLSLVAVSGNHFQKWNVVVTTLPVLRLTGNVTEKNERDRDVYTGNFTLWSGFDPSANAPTVKTSAVKWHIRGATSTGAAKKPWKLSLKKANGENNHCDLLGMGADDDWLLNSMYLDDAKVREKFAMDLWNAYAETSDHCYKMSTSEYVEVIIENEYRGLYLLQRRMDEKYLQIDKTKDILIKGISKTSYGIIYSPFCEEITNQLLSDSFRNENGCSINIINFIDINLLLTYLEAWDNEDAKNMFYVLKNSDGEYQMFFIPWDTDATLGIGWKDGYGLTYLGEDSLTYIRYRQEYSKMLVDYPNLRQMEAARWKELRETLFSQKVIEQLLTYHMEKVQNSGAFERNTARWGYYSKGEDTREGLYQFCLKRLTWLDEYYAGLEQTE